MKRVFDEKEQQVLKDYLEGKIGMFTATDEQMEVMSRIIEEAEDALTEDDDLQDDLIKWYLDKVGYFGEEKQI